MATVGRKPLATEHVDGLDGSQRAKQRMTVILETLRGQMTVPVACQMLGVCQSRFHALRHQWLQEALELLEPRQPGRRPQAATDPGHVELEQARAELQRQLRNAQLRLDVQLGLASIDAALATPAKKTRPGRRVRQRAAKQRHIKPH